MIRAGRRDQPRQRGQTRVIAIQRRFELAHRMLQDTTALNDREIRDCEECANIVVAEAERIADRAELRKRSLAKSALELSDRDFSWPQAPKAILSGLSTELFNQHSLHSHPEEW